MKTIIVIGPLADDRDAPLGWWRCKGDPGDVMTVLEGICSKLGGGSKVLHLKGCGIGDGNAAEFDDAIRLAAQVDAVVAVLGESARMSSEAHCRSELGLPGRQQELLEAACDSGKRVVLVLINGRPLSLP